MHGHPYPTVQHISRKDDVVIESNIVAGLSFTFEGRTCLLKPPGTVRHWSVVTYKIEALNPVNDWLFECVMKGSDGSQLIFHLTLDDMMHNRQLACNAVVDGGLIA